MKRLADIKAALEAVATEARDKVQAILGTPAFVFVAYPDVIDEDGDRSAGAWSPPTYAAPGHAAACAFVLRERAEQLFTQATGLPWDENAHRVALAAAEAEMRREGSPVEARDE